jgi:hypothetical protein
MPNLIQLAMALLGDLGLNNPPPKEPINMLLNRDSRGCPKLFNPSTRIMEERRAAIGCFSVISVYGSRSLPVFE